MWPAPSAEAKLSLAYDQISNQIKTIQKPNPSGGVGGGGEGGVSSPRPQSVVDPFFEEKYPSFSIFHLSFTICEY